MPEAPKPRAPKAGAHKTHAPLHLVEQKKAGEGIPRLFRLGDLLGEWEVDARAAHDARVQGIARGPVTGFASIDRELGGALCPGVHIVHGQPGAGKTAFTLQVASSCGCPCLYVTCEMAPLELLRRHTARVTRTFLGRLKTGELSPSDSLKLAHRACADAPLLAMCDATRSYAPPNWMRDAAMATKGDQPHLLIIVDSLHSWAESAATDAPEYETLNAGIVALRQMAHALNCPVLVVAERNRGTMTTGGLSAGAGTRKIEYGAETVLDMERDTAKREDAAGEVEITLKFAKNRHGAAGKKVNLFFHGALQKFRE